ncbi:MAG: SDR family oxidoreductase [Thermoleophilia bacterium]|nr:SDR family oxidoreductase [Thermoleophilia bacterium]
MGRLDGKVALVTGASHERGIGRGIALALAAEGADVACADVGFEQAGDELAGQIRELGCRSAFYRCDVAQRAQVDELFRRVEGELGSPWIVCSNAGVADWQAWTEITEDSLDRIVGVNLTGAFNVGQAAARAMVARGDGGRIVFTSSVHVQMCFSTMAVYGSTKQAVRALCETMAIELGQHGINVNHIGPGWVKSQLNDRSPGLRTSEDEEATLKLIPISRPSEPVEQGRAVVYLCTSPDGDYVTGEFLRVDGGFVVGKY